MRKRAKGCFECKELDDVLYRCRYGGEKTWIFLCENCLSLVKKNIKQSINMAALGKVKRNDKKLQNGVRYNLLIKNGKFVYICQVTKAVAGGLFLNTVCYRDDSN